MDLPDVQAVALLDCKALHEPLRDVPDTTHYEYTSDTSRHVGSKRNSRLRSSCITASDGSAEVARAKPMCQINDHAGEMGFRVDAVTEICVLPAHQGVGFSGFGLSGFESGRFIGLSGEDLGFDGSGLPSGRSTFSVESSSVMR